MFDRVNAIHFPLGVRVLAGAALVALLSLGVLGWQPLAIAVVVLAIELAWQRRRRASR